MHYLKQTAMSQERKSQPNAIFVKGAREHNLANVSVQIPRDQFVVVTGVSGSGKSSLAFDTVYAEGYRKYMDSLSTKARMLLDQVPRPDVDYVEGLSPVIALEQRTVAGSNPRSTVASVTEIADFSRVLWSLCGQAYCPKDGGRIERRSLDDCIERVFELPEGSRLMLLAPYMEARPSVLREELPRLQQRGFQRVRLDDQIVRLDEPAIIDSGKKTISVAIVVDRLVLKPAQRSRLADSLELAFSEGHDSATVLYQSDRSQEAWQELSLSTALACVECGERYPALSPRNFSWNHAEGACETCGGIGETLQFQAELLVPDPELSVKRGAIKPLRLGSKKMIIQRNALLKQLAEQLPFDPELPWASLDHEVRQQILYGTGERLFEFKLKPGRAKPVPSPFRGVLHDLEESYRTTSSEGLRARYLKYQSRSKCHACDGKRLRPESVAVLLNGRSIVDFFDQPLDQAWEFVCELENLPAMQPASDAIRGLQQRLRFLNEVGLGYLNLSRSFGSLSGGEAQRVRLATQLGMALVGVTYILDEPSIGLHAIDNQRLIRTLMNLRDRGNSVIVVEHDPSTMLAADHLIELGPGPGALGGKVIFEGPPRAAFQDSKSLSGPYLSGQRSLEKAAKTLPPGEAHLKIRAASAQNLKNVDVSIPLGLLTLVCGVSGSGKSTLIHGILAKAAAFKLNGAKAIPASHAGIDGFEHLDSLVQVDQSPIGRSPRSNPATYTKLFDLLRELFAQCSLAKVRGYKSRRFSFNVPGGRCERCKGDGVIRMDMQFMADVYVECPSCQGKRYNRETLDIRYRGYSIADILDKTVDEALDIFQKVPKIAAKLKTLSQVGLGYLQLGQSATTLSGGEAQRIKLALELSKRQQGRSLYILDEPTTGLHASDIQNLMDLLFQLREEGHTIVMIEHDLNVIGLADWVIELGPVGGAAGGQVMYAGPIASFLAGSTTPTQRAMISVD